MATISKLIFTPENHRQVISRRTLVSGLTALNWLGELFTTGQQNSFFVGDDFFKYITFMGCAPAMRLEPENDSDLNFCFIHLNTELPQPQFRGHQERFVPRCPECRHGLTDWQKELSSWQINDKTIFSCSHCEAEISIPHLNWREKAAIGSCFIEVYSVYPHEGIPTTSFMAHLKSISGFDWKYFFEPG